MSHPDYPPSLSSVYILLDLQLVKGHIKDILPEYKTVQTRNKSKQACLVKACHPTMERQCNSEQVWLTLYSPVNTEYLGSVPDTGRSICQTRAIFVIFFFIYLILFCLRHTDTIIGLETRPVETNNDLLNLYINSMQYIL